MDTVKCQILFEDEEKPKDKKNSADNQYLTCENKNCY